MKRVALYLYKRSPDSFTDREMLKRVSIEVVRHMPADESISFESRVEQAIVDIIRTMQ